MMHLDIDPEFEALCPPLSEAELAQLRANLEADGCRDPLVVWGCNGDELILDGHNRYRLCGELSIAFKTKRLTFEDRDEAKRWIITNQLGRRNLSDEQRTYLIGLLYNASKGTHGGDHGNQHTAKDQIDTLPTAADAIAEQFAVSVPTVKRAGKFATAVEKIGDAVGAETKAEILAGKSDLTKAQITKAADASNKSEVTAALRPQKPSKPKPKRQRKPYEVIQDLNRAVNKAAVDWPPGDKDGLAGTLMDLSENVSQGLLDYVSNTIPYTEQHIATVLSALESRVKDGIDEDSLPKIEAFVCSLRNYEHQLAEITANAATQWRTAVFRTLVDKPDGVIVLSSVPQMELRGKRCMLLSHVAEDYRFQVRFNGRDFHVGFDDVWPSDSALAEKLRGFMLV